MSRKNGQSQNDYCSELMETGEAIKFLETIMGDTMREDHLIAIDRRVFMQHAKELDLSLAWDLGTVLVLLECYIHQSDKVVVYQRKEVGALFRFDSGTPNTVTAVASVDYLKQLPHMMNLNDAQLVELELLLNKAGESLNMPIPFLPPATEEEKLTVLNELALFVLKTKPKAYYQRFLDMMNEAGKPVTMTQKEFLQFADESFGNAAI